MPITVLHAGVLAPVNHLAPGKVSAWSFLAVNLLIDGNAILYTLFDIGHLTDWHGDTHTLPGVLIAAIFVSVFRITSQSWLYGAYLGAATHLLLDGLVHPEMQPFAPFIWGNPIYMGWIEGLSLVLLPLTVWFIFQIVSDSLAWLRTRREVVGSPPTRAPGA
jgi:membrane-bound metal-dependent hydrolase YbcI (DUF457 family)